MINKYRLSASRYDRETEEEKISPKKVYFVSVEGNKTEREYFEGISSFRSQLGIDALVDVEVLKRSSKDGHSAPQQVLELLEEYVQLRESGVDPETDLPVEFIEKYGLDFIKTYLSNKDSIPAKQKNEFVGSLKLIGYDINYRKYLTKYKNPTDQFCIVIDRDMQTHSEDEMAQIVDYCHSKKYHCYITNPCFEFWLLLHLSDVNVEYADRLIEIKSNHKISNSHTFISKELSQKAHHGKSGIHFQQTYLPHIPEAIKRSKDFATDDYALIDNIGSNISVLIEEMMHSKVNDE